MADYIALEKVPTGSWPVSIEKVLAADLAVEKVLDDQLWKAESSGNARQLVQVFPLKLLFQPIILFY